MKKNFETRAKEIEFTQTMYVFGYDVEGMRMRRHLY